MDLNQTLSGNKFRRAALVLVATIIVGAGVWFAGTDMGGRLSSQMGIKDSIAETTGAARRVVEQTSNALNAFMGRSPGERGATDVLKGKARRLARQNDRGRNNDKLAGAPAQRALGKIFNAPVAGMPEALAPQSIVTALPNEVLAFNAPLPGLIPAAINGPGNFLPISGGGFGGGIGGIGGPGGGGGGVGVVPPAGPGVISAVPEPSTWVLLLFGFGAIGASLRRTKVLSRRVGHCAIS